MIFVIFGGGTRLKALGEGAERTCPRCHNMATWTRLRRFHELTLFFVPIARWGRRDLEACPICGEQTRAAHAARGRAADHGRRSLGLGAAVPRGGR